MAAGSGHPLGRWHVGQGMVDVFPCHQGMVAPWRGWRPPSSSATDLRPWWSVTHSLGGLFGSSASLGGGMATSLVSGGEGGSSEALDTMAQRSSR
jgi:hypothetical protein